MMSRNRHKSASATTPSERSTATSRQGDILGISDVTPGGEIPRAPDDGGHPTGIDVRQPATGFGDVPQSKGATGIDIGAAGEGTDISRDERRPSTENVDE